MSLKRHSSIKWKCKISRTNKCSIRQPALLKRHFRAKPSTTTQQYSNKEAVWCYYVYLFLFLLCISWCDFINKIRLNDLKLISLISLHCETKIVTGNLGAKLTIRDNLCGMSKSKSRWDLMTLEKVVSWTVLRSTVEKILKLLKKTEGENKTSRCENNLKTVTSNLTLKMETSKKGKWIKLLWVCRFPIIYTHLQ